MLSLRLPLVLMLLAASSATQEWTRYRGPDGLGIGSAPGFGSELKSSQIRWRTAIGKGHSSPVLWGQRIFLTAEADAGKRAVVCLDATDGEVVWERTFDYSPVRQHRFNSFASSTPTVDARHVYVSWTSGSEVQAMALDHEGRTVWEKVLGQHTSQHGSGNSPVLVRGVLVIANENMGDDSWIQGLDPATGETSWRLDRETPEGMTSYAEPIVWRQGAEEILITASTGHGLTGIRPRTGEVAWTLDPGLKFRVCATPTLLGDHIFVSGGSGGSGKECLIARLPTDQAEARVTHRPRRGIPYVPAGMGLDGQLFTFHDGGVASSIAAETGEVLWRERIEGSFFSSPVSNGSTVWIASREGVLHAIRPNVDSLDVTGRLELGGPVWATPAIAQRALFARTFSELIRIDGSSVQD